MTAAMTRIEFNQHWATLPTFKAEGPLDPKDPTFTDLEQNVVRATIRGASDARETFVHRYPCFTVAQAKLWVDANRACHTSVRASSPYEDCTLAYRAKLREEGRCAHRVVK